MNNNINGATLRKMISGAAGLLEQNKEQVDKLNVFPVPDGDTGTNMALTMQSVVKEVSLCNNNNIPDLCTAIATGALRGARGNSGVILSQIIKGLAITWSMSGKIDPKTTAKAIEHGAKIAYEAVTKPQEGTILTVIKDMAKSAKKLSRKKDIDMDDFLKGVLDAGVVSLKSTPEFLPILKEAGVVDSGGQGLLFVFQGFYNVILGREDGIIDFDINFGLNVDLNQMFHANYNSLADIEYSYCTEFFCINLQKKTTESNISRFREYLTTIGDCVLVIGDLSLIKVHVHTNDPGLALSYALSLGEISGIKIENMLEQNRVIAKENTKQKEMGVVAVCSGFGLVSIFKEMLVDAIVEGGQSMNPSAEDIVIECEKVGAKNVFVLPNNKNIILAAQQAQSLAKNCNIHVLPTTSIAQGINAMMAYDPSLGVEENTQNMQSAYKSVKSGSVTQAVRDNTTNNIEIKQGDYIGLNSNNISVKGDNIEDATLKLVDDMVDDKTSNITLYYGSVVNLEEAQEIAKQINKKYRNCDVDCQHGGQDLYHYFVSVE